MRPRIQNLADFTLPAEFRGRSPIATQLWWIVRDTLFLCSPQFMYGWRRFLLRLFGAEVGAAVLLRPTVRVTYPWKLTIGDRAWIGDFAELYNLGQITIGADAVVSQNSYLCTGSHDETSPTFDIYAKPIVVEAEAWVAADVFVAPGVTVGAGAVVGARSTIRRDVPPGAVVVGSPARFVRWRSREDDRPPPGGPY